MISNLENEVTIVIQGRELVECTVWDASYTWQRKMARGPSGVGPKKRREGVLQGALELLNRNGKDIADATFSPNEVGHT
jgi:hypothetical protein